MKNKRFLQITAVVLAFLALCTQGLLAQTTVSFSAPAGAVTIPDDGYNGSLASMASKTAAVSGIPTANLQINKITISTRLTHNWVGDLTLKLEAPNGRILALQSRAGLTEPADDGTSCCGTSSYFVTGNTIIYDDAAATPSESMTGFPVANNSSWKPSQGSILVPPAVNSFAALAQGLNPNGNWRLLAGDGSLGDQGSIDAFTITINYTIIEPCVINCPSNTTINLDPGACDEIFSYEVKTGGTCQVAAQGPLTVTQNLNTAIIQDALDCGGAPTSQWRAYSGNPGAFTINNIKIGSFFAGQTQIFIYSYTGAVGAATLNTAQMTLLGQSAVFNAPGGQQISNVPIPGVVVPAGTNYVVEQRKLSNIFVNAANYGGQTAPSYITCPLGGITVPTSYANFGFGFIHLFQVLEGTSLTLIPAVIAQTSGLPSGSAFPRGTTKNCFRVVNPQNGAPLQPLVECCFDVVVREFPNPIKTLICNDLSYFSVDANCTGTITADQILEGGPYGCYSDYKVELDKTAPFGNGPWVPAVVGPADIGKTYQVRVTDPENLNNKCWGNIKIEDKLPPVLTCQNFDLACNSNTNPNAPASILTTPTVTIKGQTGIQIVDNQTVQSNAVATQSGRITDVNVKLDLKHTWVGDMQVILESPQGTRVNLWERLCNLNDNLIVTFDDESPTCSNLCADYSQDKVLKTINCLNLSPSNLSAFDNENLNGTWKLFVNDNVGGDQGRIDQFDLIITYEAVAPGSIAATATDACSGVNLTYVDSKVTGGCAQGFSERINRKWTATDASGNSTTCLQVLTLKLPLNANVTLPPDYDGVDQPSFNCVGSQYPTPQWISSQPKPGGGFLQGTPLIFGAPDGCTINYTYKDTRIDVCGGTYKIRRVWEIINWCTGTSTEHVQLIKVEDKVGPTFACPANVTVSTDPFKCCATTDLPDVILEDNCSAVAKLSGMIIGIDPTSGDTIGMFPVGGSLTDFPGNNKWDPDTLARFGTTPCLPLGTHTVVYVAEDLCGNTNSCTFRLIVRDFTPPVAACDKTTTVAIGVDDPYDCYLPNANGCEFAGVTWVKANTFDDGSYDNCGNIKFTIRRMAPYSDCINALNSVNGHPECDVILDPFPDQPSEFERGIGTFQQYDPTWVYQGADSIKFYCCEVGSTQTVILAVYQLDAAGQPVIGPDGIPVFNECMIQVEVQDKIKPVCVSPANVTTSCKNFDPSLWAYGRAQVYDNCCLDSTKSYQGQKGLQHTVSYAQFDTLCNRGTITRTFRAFDCHTGASSQCTQRILVNYEQDYFVRFPDDRIITVCDGTGTYGEPTFLGKDCEYLAVSFTDEVFTVVPDACFKIERTWHIINWCTYNVNGSLVKVPNPNPNATVNAPANNPGPIVSAPGTPSPWQPTVVKVAPNDPLAFNYAVYYTGGTGYGGVQVPAISSTNFNGFEYKQIIKVLDSQDPVIENCPASPVTICDLTPNDPQLWNEMYWWDNTISSHDLCEGPTDLNITATDACSGANVTINYLLFLDLDGDGTMETIVNSKDAGLNGLGWNNVRFGSANGPGTNRAFDERPVPSNQKYGFALQTTKSGTKVTGAVRWNTQQSPNTYVVPELPYGTHKIKWIVEDGCGNESICEYTFIVKDCKVPTVVCYNGLSGNIMPTGMLTVWANDFLKYGEDNCTPANQLVYSIQKKGGPQVFPRDAQGNPITSVTFNCQELGTQEVELWAIDKAGNAGYCTTYFLVQDPFKNCGPAATVAGAVATEKSNGLEEATIEVNGAVTGGVPLFKSAVTNKDGKYEFSKGVPFSADFTVTPVKDQNPLNGVSTYDLVLISKHILGLEPLATPFKMIAADANKSNSITTLDIVELRKLILGIYTELPNNTSWRFVPKSHTFQDKSNPFASVFPENMTIANIQNNMLNGDFVSMKVGDVNESAVANSLMSSEDRTLATTLFDVEDRAVKAGETFAVTFKSAAALQGFQFTMNLNGLEVVDVVKSDKVSAENFGVFADALTASVDGANEFTVNFRAAKAGKLSEMLGVSSRITRAEAYNMGGERESVAFRFNNGGVSTIAGVGFELYQNQPNPFVNKTMIGFHLPEAATATLTVFDESGRVLFTRKGDFAKGYNAVEVERDALGTTGLMYYQLQTSDNSATLKMIQTK